MEDRFWIRVVYIILCIITARFVFQFFTDKISDGQYITNTVKVIDEDEDETLYLNLLVSADTDEDGIQWYYVDGIISSNSGRVEETDSSGRRFGKENDFSSCKTDKEYSVVVSVKDLQVTAIEKIQNNPISLLLRLAAFAFFLTLAIADIKTSRKKQQY